jgi:hypothetical protein
MKRLFIQLKIQDGEREHNHRVTTVTNCENIYFAAAWYAAHYWGETDWIEKSNCYYLCKGVETKGVEPTFYQHGGEIAVTVGKVEELTQAEFNLLNKLFC